MLLVEPKLWFWWCEEESSAAARDVTDAAAAVPATMLSPLRWMDEVREGERLVAGRSRSGGWTEGRLIG